MQGKEPTKPKKSVVREDAADRPEQRIPDYKNLFKISDKDLDEMDAWGWEWEPGKDLKFIKNLAAEDQDA